MYWPGIEVMTIHFLCIIGPFNCQHFQRPLPVSASVTPAPQSLATVFIIIFVFPSPRPLPCINKKFMNSDGHQMAWTVRSARVYRIQRSKSIKLNTDSRVVPWPLEEKYISYHSPTIKNDITRSDACKRHRNPVKSSDVGRQKVPCTS